MSEAPALSFLRSVPAASSSRDERVLVLTPIGRDCALTCEVLVKGGLQPHACSSIREICEHLETRAGTAILSEESLAANGIDCLVQALRLQPSWSDFPLIILVSRGNNAAEVRAADSLRPLGHVTLLERPVRTGTLLTAVRAALRSRMRQYDVRDNLEELKRAEREIRLANESLQLARDEALNASMVKSRFLANMSHELRTPLNAILGYAEMMHEELEGMGNQELLGDVQNIVSAGKHLLVLINDILDLSKIEAGQMTLVLESFDVGDLLEGIASTIAPLIRQNRNHFQLNIENQLGFMTADEVKVRQSLLNLLSNACKFTTDGRIELTARRHVTGTAEWLEFQVHDTGIGIDPSKLNLIGRDFVQLDSSQTRQHGGTGLGLSLTRRFCEMLGGQLHVDSEPGRGSTFTIQLPAETRLVG